MDEFLQQFLMFLAAPVDETPPAGGGSSEDDGSEVEPSKNDPPEKPSGVDDENLGDAGKKALQAEREARKQAEKRASELQQQIGQLEQQGTALESAQRDAEEAKITAARYRIAAIHGINPEPSGENEKSDVELFLTGATEDEIAAQAQRLKAIRKESLHDGLFDPTQGGGTGPVPPAPVDPRIAKAQQLGELAKSSNT